MGLDFGMFVKILNNPAAKANMKNLGPDVIEMMDMFKELNKIKNSQMYTPLTYSVQCIAVVYMYAYSVYGLIVYRVDEVSE